MKKLLAVAVLGLSVAATVVVSTRAEAEPRVDQAAVDAAIDARLHVILTDLLAQRARAQ